jgi:hypothetical protein
VALDLSIEYGPFVQGIVSLARLFGVVSTWTRIEWLSAKYWPALASYRTVIEAFVRENECLEALDE